MLCSARELGLNEDAAGLMDLPADLQTGQDLVDSAARSTTRSFEVNLTPNRGDCMSVAGVAREVRPRARRRCSSPSDAIRLPASDERRHFRCGWRRRPAVRSSSGA